MLVVGYFAAKFAGIILAITAFATALMILGTSISSFQAGETCAGSRSFIRIVRFISLR